MKKFEKRSSKLKLWSPWWSQYPIFCRC